MSDGSNWGQPPAADTATTEKPWNKLKPDEKKALDPDRARKETRKGFAIIAGLLLIVGGCVAATGGDDDKQPTAQSSPTADSASTGDGDSKPDASTAPAVPNAPLKAFEDDVRDDLGKSNRDGVTRVESVTFTNGLAQVRFAANDNLTENLTKTGARIDTLDVIKAAKKLPGVRQLNVIVTFSLQNDLGEVSEDPVGNVTYSADVLQRINVDVIERKKVWDVADVKSYTHPAFRF